MKRVKIFFFLILFFSCSQEHLILFKNLKRTKIDLFRQMLVDIGLSQQRQLTNFQIQSDVIKTEVYPVAKKVPVENKIAKVSEGKEITIIVNESTNFVVLKSIEGDIVYKKESSKEDKGIFVFQAGKSDSKIKFDVVDLDGNQVKKINYFINVIMKKEPSLEDRKVEEKPKPQEEKEKKSEGMETNQAGQTQEILGIGIKGIIESVIKDYPYPGAVKELERMISSEDLKPEEKALVRYALVELLLGRGDYKKAENNIAEIQNEGKKAYYSGKLAFLRKKIQDAYLQLRVAIEKGDVETRKSAILTLLSLLEENKIIGVEELSDLEKEIKKNQNDREFYGNSMVAVAELYIYFKEVYKSQAILKSIIDGDFDEKIKANAKKVYKELEENFLNYR